MGRVEWDRTESSSQRNPKKGADHGRMGRRERVKSLKAKGNKGESGKKIEGEKVLLESLGKKFTGL